MKQFRNVLPGICLYISFLSKMQAANRFPQHRLSFVRILFSSFAPLDSDLESNLEWDHCVFICVRAIFVTFRRRFSCIELWYICWFVSIGWPFSAFSFLTFSFVCLDRVGVLLVSITCVPMFYFVVCCANYVRFWLGTPFIWSFSYPIPTHPTNVYDCSDRRPNWTNVSRVIAPFQFDCHILYYDPSRKSSYCIRDMKWCISIITRLESNCRIWTNSAEYRFLASLQTKITSSKHGFFAISRSINTYSHKN